jgi:hypothetical protein
MTERLLYRIAGEGGAHRASDGRVRARLRFQAISAFLTLASTLFRSAGEGTSPQYAIVLRLREKFG